MTDNDRDIQIAAALGDGWTWFSDGREWTPTIRHSSGAGIYVNTGVYRFPGRVVVTGSWPRRDGIAGHGAAYIPNSGIPEITVSDATPPAQIAAAIAKRFLPKYLPLFNEQCRKMAQEQQHDDITAATYAALKAVAGGRQLDGKPLGALYLGLDSYAYELTANGDSVRFEAFSVPFNVATRLLTVLRKDNE